MAMFRFVCGYIINIDFPDVKILCCIRGTTYASYACVYVHYGTTYDSLEKAA